MADSMTTNAPVGVVQALNERLDTVTKLLEPLLSAPLSETVGKLSVLERCQLHILLSYTLNTTIFIYLRTQGENPKEHAVIRELERVTKYVGKIKNVQARNKTTLTVDKAAAHRFVKASLASNPDQKRKADASDESEDEESEEETNDKSHTDKSKAQGANKRRRGVDPFTGMFTKIFPFPCN
ncbi:hypothetical protein K450DRAFT_49545 [Umbelopsis ramanniana AG]|uniref:Exosome complex protein n=1 Tax=Umbelopsis ramanniana AG TaxID=1314678 RepID=A0AAD5EAN0_UMBRA|nr:uncharacterized protein K450DRAFT_49545 [Umbelopsis ramanniana AG]KAI8580208.1 hypothetical protein K450DRAFT_49545 [Umbelopsis ramanniana AG]